MTIEQYEKIMEYVDIVVDLSEEYGFHGGDYYDQREEVVKEFSKYLISLVEK
jgi:pentose-5-phosphate-3-epimerase